MRKRRLDTNNDDPSIHVVDSETYYSNQDVENEAIIELPHSADDKDEESEHAVSIHFITKKHPNSKKENGFTITLMIHPNGPCIIHLITHLLIFWCNSSYFGSTNAVWQLHLSGSNSPHASRSTAPSSSFAWQTEMDDTVS